MQLLKAGACTWKACVDWMRGAHKAAPLALCCDNVPACCMCYALVNSMVNGGKNEIQASSQHMW